jgi:hypothetical protein
MGLQHVGLGEADAILGIMATPAKLTQITAMIMKRAITTHMIKGM